MVCVSSDRSFSIRECISTFELQCPLCLCCMTMASRVPQFVLSSSIPHSMQSHPRSLDKCMMRKLLEQSERAGTRVIGASRLRSSAHTFERSVPDLVTLAWLLEHFARALLSFACSPRRWTESRSQARLRTASS